MKFNFLPFLASIAHPVSSSFKSVTGDSSCTLFLKFTLFKDGHEEAQVDCFDEETKSFIKVTSLEGSEEHLQDRLLQKFKTGELISGESTMMHKEAFVEDSYYFLPSDDVGDAAFEHKPNARNRRRLGIAGDLTVLAVRFDYADDVSTSATMAQISAKWFDTSAAIGISFKSQAEACSDDTVTVSMFTGPNIVDGVIEVDMTGTDFNETANIYDIGEEAWDATEEVLSGLPDHLVLCLPPSPSDEYNEIAGWAYLNHYVSAYNDDRCLHTKVQLHEIGHNWGLHHSTSNGEEYGDLSGSMGGISGQQACFNAPKNMELGWYSDKTVTVSDTWSGKLYGISSYASAASSDAVILYIPSTSSRSRFDIFVSFNGASGMNSATGLGADKVLVHYRNSGTGEKSSLEEILGTGESFIGGGSFITPAISVSVGSISGSTYADVTVTVEPCRDLPLTIILDTDYYPEETSWTLTNNCNGDEVSSASTALYEHPWWDTQHVHTLCVPEGEYSFTINDSEGDGIWSYNYGYGSYQVQYNGKTVASGGEFNSTETTIFGECPTFTSNEMKITFSGFDESIDLTTLITALETITKNAIIEVLAEKGFAVTESNISITSTVVSRRNLEEIDSRYLQGTSSIQQDVTVNAPTSAVNSGEINSNIATSTAASGNTNLQGLSVQASIVYEEPPWPCSGVTCGNAGHCQVTSPTTALCKCENTFIPSESGLECICPDELEFHANVNRCLPPPTAAPSDLPSVLPSLTPSMVPSNGNIDEEDPTCFDDMSGTFKLFNVMEEVECAWLTRNKDKTKVRKNKYCILDEVKSLCQSTCGKCTACDDKEGTFTLLNMKKRETCAWLTKNKDKAEKRKEAYCILDKVRDLCKASCGACTVEDRSGRV